MKTKNKILGFICMVMLIAGMSIFLPKQNAKANESISSQYYHYNRVEVNCKEPGDNCGKGTVIGKKQKK